MATHERGDDLPDEDFEALNAEGDDEEVDDEPAESYETEDEATAEEVCSFIDVLCQWILPETFAALCVSESPVQSLPSPLHIATLRTVP